MKKLQLYFCFIIFTLGYNQVASAQCCTSDGRPTTVPGGFESTFTPNIAFPNSTLSPANNARGYTGNGTAIGASNWAISSGAGAKLIRDASRATEGTDFVYVAYKASDPDSYCIENGVNMSGGTTCAAGKFVTGKRYILSADYVVFNEAAPGGGTGKAAPIFDYLTANYSPISAYVNGTIAVEETAVSWANVSTSWKKAYGIITTTNAVKRIAFSVKNSNTNRATSGILYDNTKFEQLSVTASGIGAVTCSSSGQARGFTLNPVSNFGGIPNLKYKVTAPAGYIISPLTGIYGQTTVFTLSKTTGSAIGTGALSITIADDVNTNCSITQSIADPICCTKPSVTSIAQTPATCNGLTLNNNATATITSTGDKYTIGTSTLYTAATAFSGSFTATALTAGTLQTFRIFNGQEACFKDTSILIATKVCVAPTVGIKIGNYVWVNKNKDGIQDAAEKPISGIKVSLFKKNGIKIAETTTSLTGEYYFDETNVDTLDYTATPLAGFTGLSAQTPYWIVMGEGDFNTTTGILRDSLTLTLANSNATTDLLDSDGAELPTGLLGSLTALAGYPAYCATTPSTGTDYSFDFGFKVVCKKPTSTSASVVEGSCNGAIPKDDAVVTLIGVANAIKGDKVIGTTYTNGPAFGAATNISPSGSDFIFTGLKHDTEYSFRIWNADTTCYKDFNFLTPEKVCNSACNIDITSSTKSACRDNGAGQQVYDLTVVVSWSNPPSGEPIIITSDAGGSETIDPLAVTSPQTVTLVDLPADGQAVEATATFLATISCIDTIKYNAPNCTCILPTAGTNTSDAGSCMNTTPNNDAKVTFTGVTGALKVDKVEGTTYTNGPSFGAASNVNASSGNFQLTGLKHSTTYTLRIWQSATCFIDVTSTTPAKMCTLPCPPKVCTPLKVTKK
jgi:SdrD B-like domain